VAYKVVIAQSAIEDLQEIVSYIAQDDPQVAIRVGNKLIDHALTLGAFHERCPLFDTAQGIRKTVAAPYLIIFTVENIIHFWHGARQYPDFEK
jgi:plasmid stabilization system protein ParE